MVDDKDYMPLSIAKKTWKIPDKYRKLLEA